MPRRGRSSHDLGNLLHITDRHFPKILPATNEKDNSTKKCKICCAKDKDGKWKRKESRYYCQECDVALCVVPYFELFTLNALCNTPKTDNVQLASTDISILLL